MLFDGSQVSEEFEKAFGRPITSLSVAELWWLTKFSKHIRQRARNNAAFNNYMNRNFSHARFKEVSKENFKGETYDGLEIEVKGENNG